MEFLLFLKNKFTYLLDIVNLALYLSITLNDSTMNQTVEIGDRFSKQLGKGKYADCEIVDIIQRVSTKTGNIINLEYWAKSDNYANGNSFEVAKNTVIRDRITNSIKR